MGPQLKPSEKPKRSRTGVVYDAARIHPVYLAAAFAITERMMRMRIADLPVLNWKLSRTVEESCAVLFGCEICPPQSETPAVGTTQRTRLILRECFCSDRTGWKCSPSDFQSSDFRVMKPIKSCFRGASEDLGSEIAGDS